MESAGKGAERREREGGMQPKQQRLRPAVRVRCPLPAAFTYYAKCCVWGLWRGVWLP